MLISTSGSTLAAEPVIADLGSPLNEWANRAEYRCAQAIPGKNVCRLADSTSLTVHGLSLRSIDLYFEEQKLVRICRIVDEAEFVPLHQKLTAERGDGIDHGELLKAGMGGSFLNAIWVWNDGGIATMLEQFHERVTTSSLCLQSVVEFERLMRARAARRIRGVRDL